MYKILIFVAVILLAASVSSQSLGMLPTSANIRVPVVAIDSSGFAVTADSGHVLIWYGSEATVNVASYSNRWTDAGASGTLVDSVLYGGKVTYYFVDSVADIDNNEGNGLYTGVVTMFCDGGLSWENRFSFTIISDYIYNYLAMVDTALFIDSAGYARIVKRAAWGIGPGADSVAAADRHVNVASASTSSIEDQDIATITTKLAPEGLDADTSFAQLQALSTTNLNTTVSSRGTSTLTESSNIGVNLDDVTGDLDSANFNANFWGGTIGINLDNVFGTLSDAEVATLTVDLSAATTAIANLSASFDTLTYIMGYVFNSYSSSVYYSTVDTTLIKSPTGDYIARMIRYLNANGTPDSARIVRY